MLVRVLGPLEVVGNDGTVLPVTGASQRRLLCALALRAGSVVPAERLGDQLGISIGGLHTAVSRLRREIGSAVVTRSAGYALADVDLDAVLFEQLIAVTHPCADGHGRLDVLDEALGLWRGDPYLDVVDAAWAQPDIVRLLELRAGAEEDRAEVLIELGRYTEAAASMERHRGEHPLRDHPCGLLMRALAGQGRTAEALRAYQQHRQYLAEELGTEPSVELVELERRIATGWHDTGPAATSRPARADLPAGEALDNLPAPVNSFVGRAADLTQVIDLLASHRVVALVGPGGIGKTRLAIEIGALVVDRYPDGVWLVELASVHSDDEVTAVTASTLGAPTAGGDLLDELVSWLRSRRVLVILDNCEHVLEAAAHLARVVASGCPDVTLLATSRERLAVPGERTWPVAPLAIDDAAVTLFADRARDAVPGFDRSVDEAGVREICEQLDGVPLAIELAAARVRALAPADIAGLLDQRFRFLAHGPATSPERHRSLQATVEWSYELLDEASKTLYGRLALFRGWFDLEAVRAVCAAEPLDDLAVIESLERLVEQSIVLSEDRAAGRRYRLLETLRQYGLERLSDDDALRTAERHAHHYAGWIERLRRDLEGPNELAALASLDDGWDNLRSAQAWAVECEDAATALGISAALVWEARFRNSFEAADWAKRAVELPAADQRPEVVDALVTSTWNQSLARDASNPPSIALDRAAALCRVHGWSPTVALLQAMIYEAWYDRDHEGMRAFAAAGVEQARRDGDLVREAYLLSDLATSYGVLDQSNDAHDLAVQAAEIARATNNPSARLYTELNLVMMLPDYHEQLVPLRSLLPKAVELRNLDVYSTLAIFAAGVEARAGEPVAAAEGLRSVLRRAVDTKSLRWWNYNAPDIFYVLVRNGADVSAATVHGRADEFLAENPSRRNDYAAELSLLTERLPAQELAAAAARGRAMHPRELAELVLGALDVLAS